MTDLPPDSVVRIVGKRGRYKVKRTYADGTVLLWGGTYMHERYRYVDQARLRPAASTSGKGE